MSSSCISQRTLERETSSVLEEKRRAANLSWSISGHYEQNPASFWTTASPAGTSEWMAVHTLNGALHLFLGQENINQWISELHKKSADADFLIEISKIAFEAYLYPKLSNNWQGTKDLTHEIALATCRHYDQRKPKNLIEDLRYAIARKKRGYPPLLSVQADRLLRDLEKTALATDANDFFERLNHVLKAHFHIEERIKTSPLLVPPQGSQKEHQPAPSSSKQRVLPPSPQEDWDQEVIESAEFTAFTQMKRQVSSEKNVLVPIQFKAPSLEKRRRYVSEKYGQSILSMQELARLEKEVCTGNHGHSHVHITRGNLPDSSNKAYFLQARQDQRKTNTDYYEDHRLVAGRNIRKLQETITNALMTDLDESATYGLEGQVFVPKLWRYQRLGDPKVFFKPAREHQGTLTIDLLLDASASQFERQEEVSMQAFILTEAFSGLGIPIAVWSFQNLYEYTAIRLYRDYQSPRIENKHIFDYKADGSNRDGLAIRTLANRIIKKRSEAHPILIVLSDGKPNDKRGRTDADRNQRETEYTGSYAVRDTAVEVRRARDFGIAVLGVFTGEEEDLPSVQKIYGRNFAHIQDTQQFARVVGHFMKNELRAILDQ